VISFPSLGEVVGLWHRPSRGTGVIRDIVPFNIRDGVPHTLRSLLR